MVTINPPLAYTTTNTALLLVNETATNTTILIFSAPEAPTKIISDAVLYWTEIIGYIGINGTVSIFGIIANIINIIVFIRQGVLSDSNTVSLLLLSISDFCSLVTLLWMSICYILVHVRPPNLFFNPIHMLFITGGRPHVMFVQITSWITVYIAMERCMCVVFPFRVRRLFTAKKTAIVLSSFIAFFIGVCFLPLYIANYLEWIIIPGTNRSILVMHTIRREKATVIVDYIRVLFVQHIAQPLTLFLIMFFSQITVFRVNVSRKWRQKTSSSSSKSDKEITHTTSKGEDVNKSDNSKASDSEVKGKQEAKSREKRLVKMILAISAIFVACMLPNMISVIFETLDDHIAPGSLYNNLFFFKYAFSFFLEAVNSSINIFIYYNMSTKYRSEFTKLFGNEG